MKTKILLVLVAIALLSSCAMTHDPCPQKSDPPKQPLERGEYFVEQRNHQQAIGELEQLIRQQPQNAEAYYQLGQIYGLSGNLPQAIICYRQALQIQPNHHSAYLALENIHKLQMGYIKNRIQEVKDKVELARQRGEEELKNIIPQLHSLNRDLARLHLEQAKSHLLYDDPAINMTFFPEIEAHLRDMQDLIKEMEEAQSRNPRELKQVKDPIFKEIKEMRSALSKKQARTLITVSEELANTGDVVKAIDTLRDADAQIGKFFEEEDPTAQVSLLIKDEQVIPLARKIIDKLTGYYQRQLQRHLLNRRNLQQINEWQKIEDETKAIEQILESLVQLKIAALWRFQKVLKRDAEEYEEMIPIYRLWLEHVPDSSKIGEYYYRLARCYARKGDYQQAKSYAEKAGKLLGGYRVREFLQELKNKTDKK